MNWKKLVIYLGKLVICWAAFWIGILLELGLLSSVGFRNSAFHEITTPALFQTLIASGLVVFILSRISRKLQAGWFFRWVIIEMLLWELGVVGVVLSTFLPQKIGLDISLIGAMAIVLLILLPSLFLSMLVAIFFSPAKSAYPCQKENKWANPSRKNSQRALYIIVAVFAFPLVVLIARSMARIVFPGAADLPILGQTFRFQAQTLVIQLSQGLIYTGASLPVLSRWKGSPVNLWWILGSAFSLFPAAVTSLFASGLPLYPALSITNILIGYVFTAVLISLWITKNSGRASQQVRPLHKRWSDMLLVLSKRDLAGGNQS